MSRVKISKGQYLIFSSLFVTAVLSLAYISELRLEHNTMLDEISELTVAYNEHQDLTIQLQSYMEQVDDLQKRNQTLEEVLFCRVESYLIASGRGRSGRVEGGFPSRSGYEAPDAVDSTDTPVRSISGFTELDFERIWSVRAPQLQGIGKALIDAEKQYGINALVLAGIIVHESHWGQSTLAAHKNNLAGLGAYDGSAYSSALSFSSKADCVAFLAALLARDYLTPSGKHFNGSSLRGIGKSYASDPVWAEKVGAQIRLLVVTAIDDPEALMALTADWNRRP